MREVRLRYRVDYIIWTSDAAVTGSRSFVSRTGAEVYAEHLQVGDPRRVVTITEEEY